MDTDPLRSDTENIEVVYENGTGIGTATGYGFAQGLVGGAHRCDFGGGLELWIVGG